MIGVDDRLLQICKRNSEQRSILIEATKASRKVRHTFLIDCLSQEQKKKKKKKKKMMMMMMKMTKKKMMKKMKRRSKLVVNWSLTWRPFGHVSRPVPLRLLRREWRFTKRRENHDRQQRFAISSILDCIAAHQSLSSFR